MVNTDQVNEMLRAYEENDRYEHWLSKRIKTAPASEKLQKIIEDLTQTREAKKIISFILVQHYIHGITGERLYNDIQR